MPKYQVLPLEGWKSLRAFNVYHVLMLGYKMIPAHITKSYETFLEEFDKSEDSEKEKTLREAAAFVPLEQSELDDITAFCCDSNGIPFTRANTSKMKPEEIIEIIVTVCMEISKIKLYALSDEQKKN